MHCPKSVSNFSSSAMNPNIVAFVLFIVSCVSCAQIPSSLKKCRRQDGGFQECLRAAVEDALSKSKSPVKEIALSKLDPLEIPALVIGAGSGAVAFQQNYKNMKITGFSNGKCSKADVDFKAKTMTLSCNTPLAKMGFDYEINGKILVLPIRGKGPGTIELIDLNLDVTFNFDENEKKGKPHFKITGTKLVLTPSLIKFRLENLFDGDKALGDNINQVMNDNWQDVFGDVKSGYEEAFGQIFASVFSKVLDRVSESELFGDP